MAIRGWRGRIGLLVPSVNTVVEPELNRLVPDGITVHAARMRNSRADVKDGLKMLDHVERAVDELASARVDVIAFACTTSSFVKGADGERRLRELIERSSRTKTITTSAAVVEALRTLQLQRLTVVTPYSDEVNALEESYLTTNGFSVQALRGMGTEDAWSIGAIPAEVVYRLARDAFRPDSDGLFISCTNLPTVDVIEALETDTGRPVVTSNQATLWACLRAIGCGEPVSGAGRLLRMPRL